MTPETQTPVERVSDLDGLEALARAATPGEWGVEAPMDHCLSIISNPSDPVYDWKWIATCDWPDEDEHLITSREVNANAAYIAAANPAVVLDLITRLRAAEAATEEACDVFKLIKKGGGWQAEAASNFLAGHLPSTPVAGEAK